MAERFEKGATLRFTRDLAGVTQTNKGDLAIYLGASQARIITGPSKGWVVYLLDGCPVEQIGMEAMSKEDGAAVIEDLLTLHVPDAVLNGEYGCPNCLWQSVECKNGSPKYAPAKSWDGKPSCKAYSYAD